MAPETPMAQGCMMMTFAVLGGIFCLETSCGLGPTSGKCYITDNRWQYNNTDKNLHARNNDASPTALLESFFSCSRLSRLKDLLPFSW